MDSFSLQNLEMPDVLQTGNADEIDDYLVRALWRAEVPELTPSVVL